MILQPVQQGIIQPPPPQILMPQLAPVGNMMGPKKGQTLGVPQAIGNLELWMDAQKASTLTLSGIDVTAWNSRVNGYSAVPGASPDYEATYDSSLPYVVGNGSTEFLTFGNILDSVFAGADKQFTICLVIKGANTDPFELVFGKQDNSGTRQFSCGTNSGVAYISANTTGGTYTGNGTTSLGTINPASIFFEHDGTIDTNNGADRWTVYLNNVDDTGANGQTGTNGANGIQSGTTALTLFSVLNGPTTPLAAYTGGLAELCVYSKLLSSADRSLLQTYLAAKWSL